MSVIQLLTFYSSTYHTRLNFSKLKTVKFPLYLHPIERLRPANSAFDTSGYHFYCKRTICSQEPGTNENETRSPIYRTIIWPYYHIQYISKVCQPWTPAFGSSVENYWHFFFLLAINTSYLGQFKAQTCHMDSMIISVSSRSPCFRSEYTRPFTQTKRVETSRV